MQKRTQKTLATAALSLAAVAAAAGSASAADLTSGLNSLPVGQATNLLPGAAASASGAQQALTHASPTLPTEAAHLLPAGNHLSGNSVAPLPTLLGGLPTGTSILNS
ncbi:ATP-binding protein [Streptomyces sp. NBC_01190]|uniref:ATP-binding protein n=1 Tax=Streptomyces sp. NBC_01190 TaxID=2903767 RepID=UPI00386F7BBA|nr:hypothetical protein OG519_22065 [Streptomyces sp. NBC_01190]